MLIAVNKDIQRLYKESGGAYVNEFDLMILHKLPNK